MEKNKKNILDVFEEVEAAEEFDPEVVSMIARIENLAFNSNLEELTSALNEFSEKYPVDAEHIKKNQPAFFANVHDSLSKKRQYKRDLEIENLMMKGFGIKLYIRH